ncbi:MAG TPA: 6,7-dimethyl-8-ribityllumazine synthase [Candidatus Hydrothermia bacterium]|nr:6,7-dimethyl-8-ribityllumazine synthase [Candidatus Hydrothermia bacterium]HOK23619.1 6,7-dimethyl-8-ribityllumazine synthase [Candidatus Hydrothermia bacterium]HOL24331.1 6,7-dimethyl-8-ribityllumazine synthase [Candidatus Hydrothermia bacterium]HOP31788.1 6,7-dimethyl-8-ribityllumazine synthase [Candidatus Hydrothermia bacterium]HPO79310.1 6,7-dimethyl-8-ribityllumazine synthase [Candidatus Hydrothermia bacterium]
MEYIGEVSGKGKKIGIVASRFNEFVTERLVKEAIEELIQHGVTTENIDVYKVPGSFEIPLILKHLLEKKLHDGYIALGAVIRGDTPHFEYIAGEVSRSIGRLNLDYGVPIVFGIITADTMDDAVERAGGKKGNKGRDAARTLLEILGLLEKSHI